MKDQLASKIKLGDEQAFELLFRKYYVRLCGFANKYSNDPDEAKEVVQETFIKVWVGKNNINTEESLPAYLFKITQNNCLNRLRRKRIESKYIEIYKVVYIDFGEISPYEALLAEEINSNIQMILRDLPPKCKRVFELSRIEGLKYSEIAEILQISIKTVEAHMSKALQIMRHGLREYIKVLIIICMLFW